MHSNIHFRSIDSTSGFLDPRRGFRPAIESFQVRFDPLTGRSCHLSHMGAAKLQKLDLEIYSRPEIKGFCPFCKGGRDEKVPKYPEGLLKGGRLTRGEAFLFPDLYPYDQFNAVTVMTDDHVVPLESFTEKRLSDSFQVGIDFLKTIGASNPHLPYHVMAWNYMPPSGGDFVHPHQLYLATEHPGNLFMDEFRASEEFFKKFEENYWQGLILEENERAERYIGGIGDSHWLVSFTSQGVLGEVMGIFPAVYDIGDFSDNNIADLVAGLRKIFRYFVKSGIGSFNAALFFGSPGQEFFSAHLRIVPRTFSNTRDFAGDLNSFQVVLSEPVCVVWPEDLCRDVKRFF